MGANGLRNCPLPGTRSVCLGRNQAARSRAEHREAPNLGECSEGSDLDRRLRLRPRRHRQEAPQPRRFALHIAADPISDPIRKNRDPPCSLPEPHTTPATTLSATN